MGNVARGACLIGALWLAQGCGSASQAPSSIASAPVEPAAAPPEPEPPAVPTTSLADAVVIELAALRSDTARFQWFDFKPGVRKLILSGTPTTRHVSVLWYGYEGKAGKVPLHYHAQTESIFVIDGAQSDAKGQYGKGSFYFNPPGSGHDVFDSSGLFLLSYAAPPDFTRTADIVPYENAVIGPDYSKLPLASCEDGSLCYAPPLVASGGMRSRFTRPQGRPLTLTANVVLVLQGACEISGQTVVADTLVVTKSEEPSPYHVKTAGDDCLLFEMAFM
jgi:hypothetical protein